MSSKAKHPQNGFHLHAMPTPSSTPMEVSPPSTPSRHSTSSVLPLYTSSPSNASSPMCPSPLRPHVFGKDDTGIEQLSRSQRNSIQIGMSSICTHPGSCMSMPTTPEVTNNKASLEKVSLEQHMQHADLGREKAMQSFILERFLPAAKAVATDHDHTGHPESKHHPMNPSMASHMSMLRSAKSASRLYSIPSTFSASKGVTWSSPLSQDEGDLECSDDDDEPTKSGGFFCVGIKTAISGVHKVVHPCAYSPSRNKSRAARSYGNGTSCEEEVDVLPKVHALLRRKNSDTTASYAFSPSAPTVESILRSRHSRYVPSSGNRLPRIGHVSQDGSPLVRRTSLDATFLHTRSASCHSFSPSVKHLRCSSFQECSSQGNAWQGSLRPPCDQSCAHYSWEQVENFLGGTISEDYHSQNASRSTASDVSVRISANEASSKESTPGHDALERVWRESDLAEDEDHEFYDALDCWSPIPDNVVPFTCAKPVSPKVSGCSKKWASDENGAVDVPNHTEAAHVSSLAWKASGEGALSDSACIAPVKQKHRKPQADQGNESIAQTTYTLFPLQPSSASPKYDRQGQGGTPNGHKKCLISPKPGWPLGIAGFQSGAEKSSFREQEDQDDRYSITSVSAFTESNVSSPRVPPSPSGSWLERAVALNASKPSTLATLQRKEIVLLARKKLEFTLSETRKNVKWEDVVKENQMHPEHLRFSEELRHRHPSNRRRKAIKPCGL